MSRHAPPGGPHAIDHLVGLRIRRRRHEIGLSQERLGKALGLSFQQIQKYENASNRVTASTLFEIARMMGVSPDYFFQDTPAAQTQPHTVDPLAMTEAKELLCLLPRLERRDRRVILDLIRGLGDRP